MKLMITASAALIAIAGLTSTVDAKPAKKAAANAAVTAKLIIRFAGVETKTGAVMFSVFDGEAAFDGDGKPVRVGMVPANATSIETALEGLPVGRYGIKAFHDVNGDHQMAVNPFGMPTEPFAFSNNAVGNMGPAKWADAAFSIAAGSTRHTISIR
jgi:uncharacterized protein (DUF2141 family)